MIPSSNDCPGPCATPAIAPAAQRRRPRVRASIAALTTAGAVTLLGPGLVGLTTAAAEPGAFSRSSVATAGISGTSVNAQAPDYFSERVVDRSGILDASQKHQIEEAINQLQLDSQQALFVVFQPSFGGMPGDEWTQQAVELNGGNNVAVYAVATESSMVGLSGGTSWDTSDLEAMQDAAYEELNAGDLAGSALAVVEEAANSGSVSGESVAWLGGGAAVAVAAGAGIWAYTRNKRKKEDAALLEDSREIAPTDTRRLMRLPIHTLEDRANEELVSTDESIRRGREELDLAIAEFGPERTRSFTRAMNHSTTTLQHAFQLQQRLNDSVQQSDAERRNMLVEIVSSCGQADDALDKEAENFAEMRNLLVNAGAKLDDITQQTVDLRARLPEAEELLQRLRDEYPGEVLQSIDDNIEAARVSLEEAEKALSRGRELEEKPAGQQGGLIETIRDGEHALDVAHRQLLAIEHADENIRTARAGLDALIAEVEGEIREATQLREQSRARGVQVDRATLEDVVDRARTAVDQARSEGDADPLGNYSALNNIDAELDAQLDRLRATAADQKRLLQLFDQQISSANAQLQSAEDLISSRGRVIGARARASLAEAKRMHAMALQNRLKDTRSAIESARHCASLAGRASIQAQGDIEDYRNRHNRGGGSGAGMFVAGMVINGLLSSGGRGGFGGGGFGGGGFGGGGGGGSFGGRF